MARTVDTYGREHVFKDVDSIPLGVDFRKHLGWMVGQCGVLIAVIGEGWLDARDVEGNRRLHDPSDFVRVEIEQALERGIPVIPVLVRGAVMPSASELPDSLQPLASRNGLPVRADPDFHNDMDRLIGRLRRPARAERPLEERSGERLSVARRWLEGNAVWLGSLGAIAGVLALLPLVLSEPKAPDGNVITAGNGGEVRIDGTVVQVGDGGTATVHARDELDRKTIASLLESHERLLAENEGLKDELEQAVLGLGRIGAEQGHSEAVIYKAKEALTRGDTTQAEALYLADAERKRAEGTEALKAAAESYRSLGALAFLHDTEAALGYYGEATRLDPDNPGGWNQLGHLQRRVGELEQAERAYRRVLELADQSSDPARLKAVGYGSLGLVYEIRGELERAVEMHEKSLALFEALGRRAGMAIQHGNLGLVYFTRGELDRAVEMYEQALALDEALGHKAGVAANYGNLGLVYYARGEFDRAVEMYEKSLAIDEALEHKEGMANQYGNLGLVYHARGEFDRADNYWQRASSLFTEIGSPNAAVVQGWIDALEK